MLISSCWGVLSLVLVWGCIFGGWFIYLFIFYFISIGQCRSSLRLRPHAHGPLAKRLMHMAHLAGNTSGVSKSSSDWLDYTGFPGDVCVAFFNVPRGNKNAMAPNPLMKEASCRVYN